MSPFRLAISKFSTLVKLGERFPNGSDFVAGVNARGFQYGSFFYVPEQRAMSSMLPVVRGPFIEGLEPETFVRLKGVDFSDG